MYKILSTIIFLTLQSSLAFADHIIFQSTQDKSSGYFTDKMLDKYAKEISLLSSQKYKGLQLIITSQQNNKGGTVLVSIVIEPNGWETFSSDYGVITLGSQLKLDDKIYDEAEVVIIQPLYQLKEYQEFGFSYTHKAFKEFVKSNQLNLIVRDFEISINLNKLHLEKFNLQ